MSFALISRMLATKAGFAAPKPNYPLVGNCGPLDRARLGGVINLAGAFGTFITAQSNGSLLQPLGEPQALINAYGKIQDGEFLIHRFYFGDQFLQVVSFSVPGTIVTGEIKLFQKLAEITPASPEEWDLWIKGVDGNQPLLTGPTIKWQDATEFTRVWSPGQGMAEPKRWREAIDVGQPDSVAPDTSIAAMLFSRRLGADQNEWLQLSMCRSGSERWIEAYVGLSLEPGELFTI